MDSSLVNESRSRTKNASPLMFESEDEDEIGQSPAEDSKEEMPESVVVELTKEEKIFKGLQTVMSGIPPPPAFTVPQLDCREILKLWRDNQSFVVGTDPDNHPDKKVVVAELVSEASTTAWPSILSLDHWDVYYNRSRMSEQMEQICMRYKERYVGAETSSSINPLYKSPSRTASARKRARTRMWGHSPGRRLSHLARRRKAFSSASLCSVAGNNNPDKKMIMVEIKKMANRQKKKNSAKKTKPTPKKLKSAQSSTYKRALFQSPDQLPKDQAAQTPSSQCIQRSKRSLFVDSSSEKKVNGNGKRERQAPRRVSPRKRVNRSLSFQESSQAPAAAPPSAHTGPAALTGAHKQKMLWAVTNALRDEGMGMSHELFRPSMTVLFKSCQRLWLTRAMRGAVEGGSTSENMLALAKQFTAYTISEVTRDPTTDHLAVICAGIVRQADTVKEAKTVERKTKDPKRTPIKSSVKSKATPKTLTPNRITRQTANNPSNDAENHGNTKSCNDERSLVDSASGQTLVKASEHSSPCVRTKARDKKGERIEIKEAQSDLKTDDGIQLQQTDQTENEALVFNPNVLINDSSTIIEKIRDILKKGPSIKLVPCDLMKTNGTHRPSLIATPTSQTDVQQVSSPILNSQTISPMPGPSRRVTRSSSSSSADKQINDAYESSVKVLGQSKESPVKIHFQKKELSILRNKSRPMVALSQSLKSNNLLNIPLLHNGLVSSPKESHKLSSDLSSFTPPSNRTNSEVVITPTSDGGSVRQACVGSEWSTPASVTVLSCAEDSNAYFETNKENIITEGLLEYGKNSGPLVLCVENTPGGRPLVVYDDVPPTLVPHWVEVSDGSDSPPSLVPHWEDHSLPETIMPHWQTVAAPATSDKVMFDFEDTSYEITFPTDNDDDTRASSTCAPFDLSHLIDDSKSSSATVFSTKSDSCNR